MIRIYSISRKSVIILFSLITIAIILLGVFVSILMEPSENRFLIVRVDDIQDFAFRNAQLFLLEHSTKSNLPLSLGIIVGMFGEDTEILEAVNEAVAHGCEVGVHGWEHENLTSLSKIAQIDVLFLARTRIENLRVCTRNTNVHLNIYS